MKKNEDSFRENIKRAFSAFAFEHSDEMLSTFRKSQVLSGVAMKVASKKDHSVAENKVTDPE